MILKNTQIKSIGEILFFIGIILILISWYFSYPIYIPEFDEIIFTQFYPSIWPGMILSLLGLFLIGYYAKRKCIKIICISIFPIIINVYSFFFSYIPTSDSGSIKAMFEIFHYSGFNTTIEPYFHFPIFFTLNEMTSQILGFDTNSLALIFFTLFGILIAIYIYLFIFKITNKDIYQIAFLTIPIYFVAVYNYLNYQWVPQTLALIFFLILLLLFNHKKSKYKFLCIIIFTVLVFTHLFIPAIFLMFMGIYAFKKREFRNIFLLMSCIYITVLIYYTTFFLSEITDVFRKSIYGFGQEYILSFSKSLMEPKGLISQIISTINRIRVPLIWIILSIGFFILFIKRKIRYTEIALALTGIIYLGIGIFYSILGTRALQILCIPLLIGLAFFIFKWRKATLLFVSILLILSIFGPMRSAYDNYQFQLNEEDYASNFLAFNVPTDTVNKIAINGINYGYLTRKSVYINFDKNNYNRLWVLAPRNLEFYNIFNGFMNENEYIIFNSNMYKEIVSHGLNIKEADKIKDKMQYNNKIYICGKTCVFVGLSNISKDSQNIQVDSFESPIGKYFTIPKILWTFDDYNIRYKYYPPHKGFGGLTERILSYGGHVNIMTYFTSLDIMNIFNNEIRNYSVVNDFGYSQENINESLKFFSKERVTVGCHGWTQSDDINYATLNYAYKVINYTLWNFKNNYNITPHFFLGHSTSGNYNVTLALKQFSENYWTVYGENFRADETILFPEGSKPAIHYITEVPYVAMFDPLFGQNWGVPCKTLNEAQKLYNNLSLGKEIIFIRGHPANLNQLEQKTNLTLWQQWIDWIYNTHQLININHTEAIYYNFDRYNFRVIKNNDTNYTIDLTQCNYNHNLLFRSPYENDTRSWILYNENGKHIGTIQGDTFLNVEPRLKYYFTIQ